MRRGFCTTPKRFYKEVKVVPHPLTKLPDVPTGHCQPVLEQTSYWGIELDNRLVKTLYKDDLIAPTEEMAYCLAEEWDSQKKKINQRTMRLNTMLAKAEKARRDPEL